MLGPPAFPSQPPPPREDAVRPMTLLVAGLWVLGAFLLHLQLSFFAVQPVPGIAARVVAFSACQAAAYGFVVFAIVRRYGQNTSLSAFVALRGTHPGFYPLAAILGVSGSLWASWLEERMAASAWMQEHYPQEKPPQEWVDSLASAGPPLVAGLALALVVMAPAVEELLFRGAVFTPMGKEHRLSTAIAASALMFAFVHRDPRLMPSIFLLGAALGGLRAMSGSLWPPLCFHVAFNGIAFLVERYPTRFPKGLRLGEPTPVWMAFAALAVFLAVYAAAVAIAKYSRLALRARQAAAEI